MLGNRQSGVKEPTPSVHHPGCRQNGGRGDFDRIGGHQPLRADQRRRRRPGRTGDCRNRLCPAACRANAPERPIAPHRRDRARHHQSALFGSRAHRRERMPQGRLHDLRLQYRRRHRPRDAHPQNDADAAGRRPHPHFDALRRPARPAADGGNPCADSAHGQRRRGNALRLRRARRRRGRRDGGAPTARSRASPHRGHRRARGRLVAPSSG